MGVLVIEATAVTPLGPRIVYANEEACRLAGYDRESIVGSPLGLVYDRRDLPALLRRLPAVANSTDFCYMDRDLIRRSNLRIPVRWTIRPTRRNGAENVPGFFTLTFSLLEGKGTRAQNSTPSTKEETAPANRTVAQPETTERHAAPSDPASGLDERSRIREQSVSIRAGGVAHDFKNALQQMMSNLELAEKAADSVGPAAAKLREYLGGAMEALSDAETLALQMLAFSRGEGGECRPFEIGDLVQRASRLATAGANVRLRTNLHPGLAPVEGDPDQIYQVLNNLLINAAQAMPNGGVIDLSATTRVFSNDENDFSLPAGKYTVLSVRDRGIGIAPENLARIFSPDFTTKSNGCGFGLASCKAIVEEHGGRILVASRPGVGTQFLVVLPATEKPVEKPSGLSVGSAEKPNAASQPNGRSVRPAACRARILVIDDEPGVCRSTCLVLEHFGHRTCTAASGEEGLSVFRRHLGSAEPIDLVLVDMTLPGGIDGRAVCRAIRELDESVPVIATSGYFDGQGTVLVEPGFDGAIAKPFTMDALDIVVSQALEA